MTRRQRAQVVELLRCAADQLNVRETAIPIYWAADDLGLLHSKEHRTALRASGLRSRDLIGWGQSRLLEAALRVERMEWP